MSPPLRIGTRRSALALAQSRWVASRLRAVAGLDAELVPIVTEGDRLQEAPLAPIPTRGIFVRELEAALLDGRVDLCVHSAKDLPPALPDGLDIVAFPERADVRDALVADVPLAALPSGARVGTGSLRRAIQLRRLRDDLRVVPIRGNVDTRVGRVLARDLQGVVLAACGLQRLGLAAQWLALSTREILPAAGQGALAIEVASAGPAQAVLRALDDPWTRLAVLAERAVLIGLGGGCSAPIGAWATVRDGGLHLEAAVWGQRTLQELRVRLAWAIPAGPPPLAGWAQALGVDVAERLCAQGAPTLLGEAKEDGA